MGMSHSPSIKCNFFPPGEQSYEMIHYRIGYRKLTYDIRNIFTNLIIYSQHMASILIKY